MSLAESLLLDFDQEMANTRKVLERLPEDRLDWKAHPKSQTIGWNANHVADLVNWLVVALSKPSLDVAPVGGEPYQFPKLTSRAAIVELSRQERGGRAESDQGGQRRRHEHHVDAVASRQAVVYIAAVGRGAREC